MKCPFCGAKALNTYTLWNHMHDEHTMEEMIRYAKKRDGLSEKQIQVLRLVSLKKNLLEYLGFENPYKKKVGSEGEKETQK